MASDAALTRLHLAVGAHPGLVLDPDEDADEFAKEVGDLGTIVKAHAGDAETLVMCVYAYRKLGQLEAAHAVAQAALALGRTFETVSAAATVFRAEADAEAAGKLFDEAAAIDPTDTSALMESGKTFGQAERFADAEKCFARAFERDPQLAEAEMWAIYSGYAGCVAGEEKPFLARMKKLVKANPADDLAAEFLEKMEDFIND